MNTTYYINRDGAATKRLTGTFPSHPSSCAHERLGEKTWLNSSRPWRSWERYEQFCLECGLDRGGFILDRRNGP